MHFDPKATCRYLRRRHKLYKAVNNQLYACSSQSVIQKDNFECSLRNKNQFQVAFTQIFSCFLEEKKIIFHNKIIMDFKHQFLNNIILLTQFHSGHKLAYIVYRLCKQNPNSFKIFVDKLSHTLQKLNYEDTAIQLETCLFYTDLFLYGFNFTSNTFINKVHVHAQRYIIAYVIRLPKISQWEVLIAKKHLFKIKNSSQNWINRNIKQLKAQFQNLEKLRSEIHELEIKYNKQNAASEDDQQIINLNRDRKSISQDYQTLFAKYQQIRKQLVYLQRNQSINEAKDIETVKRQCEYYEPSFRLPDMLSRLYKQRQVPKMEIKRVKANQMLSIFEDQAFLRQFRVCGSIQKAVDLAAYFIANLSTETNLQQLIQFFIDYCHYESNLDLILRIIAEINCLYPEIGQYLNKKSYKILSKHFFIEGQIKMNKKYLNIICQGTKFGLIRSHSILDHIHKRLKTQHTQMSVFQTVRDACSILQLLGQGTYHQSLRTNIFVNSLLDLIGQKIKESSLGSEFTFNLKCVKNYLRQPHLLSETIKNSDAGDKQTLNQLSEQLTLQQNFQLILKRIKELLSNKSGKMTQQSYNKRRIINYLVQSIQNQSSFINTYYEASLIKQLNHKQIREIITVKCIQKIQNLIAKNTQQALRWSRFLGELYNYEIINRKKLVSVLEEKLLYSAELSQAENFQQMAKSILQCLNTSKSYIIDSEVSKQNNHYILTFLIEFKRSILNYLKQKSTSKGFFNNVMIENQIEETFEYFHSCLNNKLKTTEQIDIFTQKVKFCSPNNALLSINLYKILSTYANCQIYSDFDPTMTQYVRMDRSKQHQNIEKKISKKQMYKIKQELNPNFQDKGAASEFNQARQAFSRQISQLKIDKLIEEINQSKRNQQIQSLSEEQRQDLNMQNQMLQQQLKKMMGITPKLQIQQNFPLISSKNVSSYTCSQKSLTNSLQLMSNQEGFNTINIKKILRNQKGKKLKIIARKRTKQQEDKVKQ